MSDLVFATGNGEKFQIARKTFSIHGIDLKQARLEIDEIQEENPERIVIDKVTKAFQQLGRPVVVNDDTWSIPGLRGFPGPYMKSVSHWFTAEDFLNLTRSLEDRRVVLSQRIAYKDKNTEKVFMLEYTGELLQEARGSYGISWQKVITMPGDNGLSVAEVYDKGIVEEEREVAEGWEQFIAWYEEYRK